MDWLTLGMMVLIIILIMPTPRGGGEDGEGGFFGQDLSRILGTSNLVAASPLRIVDGQRSPLLPSQVPVMSISPFIRHWEAAKFDAEHLVEVNSRNLENRKRRRRRRDVNGEDGGVGAGAGGPLLDHPQEPIRMNFSAHDREFKLVLLPNPTSVFADDVQFESTSGPIDYDVGRIHSGHLEGDEDTVVHGVFTHDHLFDGTITTPSEVYYLEPARKYSDKLIGLGIHSVVYKVSDVRLGQLSDRHSATEHCASEQLHRRRRGRQKRWMPEEFDEGSRNWAAADIDVPYNDEMVVVERNNGGNNADVDERTSRNGGLAGGNVIISRTGRPNQSVLYNQYPSPNNNNNGESTVRTSNRNIIGSIFDRKRNPVQLNSTIYSSRPVHKNHVEIITKRPPNIIVNNYNPDVVISHPVNNQGPPSINIKHQNINLNVRNELLERSRTVFDKKSTCMLYLQADHTFFQKLGSDDASIEAITRHVQRANAIYKNTDFNGDGKPDNITFMIKRIKVHNLNALKDPTYRFPGNYGVEKFLELFSEEDYDAFCLAYMFTYRDFEMGTLGLAWTGDLKNAGGVCEKNGHYRGSLKSLNTGIVTLLNYGKHVPPAVSHVTLAHEIGHNFGSPHDPEQCTPGGEDGNFIMFARATSGDKKNNNKFSPCSLKAIEPVLNAKARSAKGCFTEPQSSICGNGVVEPGEECDCGWEEDCKDKCCYPMTRHPRIDEKPCTLTPGALCSPSQGPCCTSMCSLKLGDKCRDDNGCRDESYCDGQIPICPPSINKPNKTICNVEFVCYMGECTGSICLAYGLESCQCIPGANDPPTKSCELCCKQPGEEGVCKSSFEWKDPPYDMPSMFAKPGTPCNDYNGYCDVFQKCREVDPSGPLATLRKLLLSEESIASFKKWVQSNWFAVALIIVAIVTLLVLSTKLLNKRTNKKLKSMTIIHSATTETVRLPEDNNGVIVHTAVRTKVPFKQKVRGERKKKSGDNKKPSGKATNLATAAAASADSKVLVDRKDVAATGVVRPKRKKTSATTAVATAGRSPQKQQKQKQQPSHQHQRKLLSLYKSKSSSSKKEIIDYSKRLGGSDKPAADSSAIKVQKWLLESPANAGNDGENSSISGDVLQGNNNATAAAVESIALKKSVSTPERLLATTSATAATAQKKNVHQHHHSSLGQEKVKLQVVYKPPFKFSLKLKKRNPVSTTVVSPYRIKKSSSATTAVAAAGKKSGTRTGGGSGGEKNRIGIMSSSSQDKSTILRKNRLALLIRSAKDDEAATSRADEALLMATSTGGKSSGAGSGRWTGGGDGNSGRHYENVDLMSVDHKPVNSATFRIKKSSSSGNTSQLERNGNSGERRQRTGSSTMKSNNSRDSIGADTTTMASDKSRDIKSFGGSRPPSSSYLATGNNSSSAERRGSGSLRDQLGGSSGNLVMRSSTTNLAKMGGSGGGGGNSGFQKNERVRNSLNMQRQLSSPAGTGVGSSSFRRTSDSNSNVLLGRNATATSIQNNLQNGNMIMFKKLSTSNTNLAKFSDEFLARRASNTSLNNFGVPSRRPSISSGTPKRRASINSHRQSANGFNVNGCGSGGGGNVGEMIGGSFDRRASMGSHNTKKSKGSHSGNKSAVPAVTASSSRPHTAACDTEQRVPFEWPPPPPPRVAAPTALDLAAAQKRFDEPLPSDMEVLCSDVEHT